MESTFGDEPHGRGMREAIVSKSEAAALLVHALHVACGAGDATRAAAALDAGAALEQRTHGVTPLESAVLAGSVAIVELLLAKGADPNLCDPAYPGATPLWALRPSGCWCRPGVWVGRRRGDEQTKGTQKEMKGQ